MLPVQLRVEVARRVGRLRRQRRRRLPGRVGEVEELGHVVGPGIARRQRRQSEAASRSASGWKWSRAPCARRSAASPTARSRSAECGNRCGQSRRAAERVESGRRRSARCCPARAPPGWARDRTVRRTRRRCDEHRRSSTPRSSSAHPGSARRVPLPAASCSRGARPSAEVGRGVLDEDHRRQQVVGVRVGQRSCTSRRCCTTRPLIAGSFQSENWPRKMLLSW